MERYLNLIPRPLPSAVDEESLIGPLVINEVPYRRDRSLVVADRIAAQAAFFAIATCTASTSQRQALQIILRNSASIRLGLLTKAFYQGT